MQYTLQLFGPSTRIVTGDDKCPRCVVVQILAMNTAAGAINPNVFICTDRARLDQARPIIAGDNGNNGALSDGVPVIDFLKTQDTLVLRGVTKDIFARAAAFTQGTGVPVQNGATNGTPITLSVEIF